jgi:hypothetical protein
MKSVLSLRRPGQALAAVFIAVYGLCHVEGLWLA